MTDKFQNIYFELNNLPSMPTIAAKMVELINAPDTSAEELTQVIAKDPAVAARVLKIANSSFYSMSREITNLATAVVIIGQQTLNGLVLAASLRGMNKSFGQVEQLLWEDSMVCAIGSRYLAQKLGLANPDEAFMAGLFRHIGLTVLNNQESVSADFILTAIRPNDIANEKVEIELLGSSHAEIGAAILEYWQLPMVLSLVALHHFDVALPQGIDDNTLNLTGIVNIAGYLPSYFGIYGELLEQNIEQIAGVEKLNLDVDTLTEVIDDFHEIFKENRSAFLS